MHRKIASIVLLIMVLITGTPANAQTKGKNTKTQPALTISAGDLRAPQILAKSSSTVDLGDGFTASKNLKTIDVHIPGAFMDGLNTSRAAPLPVQLAAAAFTRVFKTDAASVDDAVDRFCKSSNPGKTGSGDAVTFHSFRLANGHKYKIFVYLNDFDGLMAIISAAQ